MSSAQALHNSIINGNVTEPGEFPAVGALLIRGIDRWGDNVSGLCTGTLVAPDVVLSAAHCALSAMGARQQYFFSLADNVAHAGQQWSDMPARTYPVRVIAVHPEYHAVSSDGLDHANDLGLVFLDSPVANANVATMMSQNDTLSVGTPALIVGYGMDTPQWRSHGTHTGIKRDALTRVNELGAYEMQIGDHTPLPQKCIGDSGGPTFVQDGDQWLLAGVTSRAYDRSGCMKGGIDTLVAPLRDWVESEMQAACDTGIRAMCAPTRSAEPL